MIRRFSQRERLTRAALLCFIFGLTALWGCAETRDPGSIDEHYDSGTSTGIETSIEFTNQSYDFQGETSIDALKTLVPEEQRSGDSFTWFGAGEEYPYPQGNNRIIASNPDETVDCSSGFFDTNYAQIDELPVTIEGRVTLAPPKFEKQPVCGQDQYYEGSFMIEDETAGIMVLKNSMIDEFTYGDRVRLSVNVVGALFGRPMVIAYDSETVVERDQPLYFESIDRAFNSHLASVDPSSREDSDLDHIRRITGEITQLPTSENFNAMVVSDGDIDWEVALGMDFGRRPIPLKEGDRIQLTGPVVESFGTKMLIHSYGQIEWLNRDPFETQ
jgi:hypothetical protein